MKLDLQTTMAVFTLMALPATANRPLPDRVPVHWKP